MHMKKATICHLACLQIQRCSLLGWPPSPGQGQASLHFRLSGCCVLDPAVGSKLPRCRAGFCREGVRALPCPQGLGHPPFPHVPLQGAAPALSKRQPAPVSLGTGSSSFGPIAHRHQSIPRACP
eukprot:991100-Amphidinium_carterae.1